MPKTIPAPQSQVQPAPPVPHAVPVPAKEEARYVFGSPDFRAHWRREMRARPDGRWYAAGMLALLLGIVGALAIWMPAWELSFLYAFPGYFLFCNLAEYLLHRYPMHRRMRGFEKVYEHVTIHHNFYADEFFYFERPEDYYAAVLPPYVFLGAAAAIGAVSGGLYFAAGAGQALFFALVGWGYYLLYELLHFAYHAPEPSWLKRVPGVRRLARVHLHHHRTDAMAHSNFNITFPVFDWLFGTLHDEA